MGNILDSGKKQQIEDIAQTMLKDFTLAYTTAYSVEYSKKILEEIDEESFGQQSPTYLLMHRQNDKVDVKLKTGFLTKKGAVVKNWKRRYFVVFPDHSVEYYENDEAFNKGFKAKGTIVPSGYTVVPEVDKALLERAQDLAKQLGVSEKDIPVGEKLPDHTFQLYHSRRRSFFISADSAQEKEEWVDVFKSCCHRSQGLRSEDPVARAAFKKAVLEITLYFRGGTEEQVLSDIIVDKINYKVMSDAYHSIPGPYAMRQKVREQVVKSLDSLVMAMVIPAWKGMVEATEKAKATLEPTIKDKKDELAAVQRKVMWELAEALQSTMDKALADVQEMIKEMGAILRPHIAEALKSTRELYVKKIDEMTEQAMSNNEIEEALKSYFYTLDKVSRSSFAYYLVNGLWRKLHDKFDESIPTMHEYGVVYLGEDFLKEILDSAMYTFEELFTEEIKDTDAKTNGRTAADKMRSVKEDVLGKFDTDSKVVEDQFVLKGMMYVWVRHIHDQIDSTCKPIIKPIERTIPDPLRQIITLNDKYNTYVENVVRETIQKVCGLDQSTKSEGKAASDDISSAAEPKSSETGEKSGESEAKPTEAEEKPKEDEATSTDGEVKPSEDHVMPSGDEAKPSEGEVKANEDEAKPSDDHVKPSGDEAKPSEGEVKANQDEAKPSEDYDVKPSGDEAKPSEGEASKADESESHTTEL